MLEECDVSVLLSCDVNGIYCGFIEENFDGKWCILLMLIDDSWKI